MQWRDATVGGMGDPRAARQEPDVSQVIGQFDQASYPGSGYEGSAYGGQGYPGQVGLVEQFGSAEALPVGLDLPCTEDPELFFAESPSDVEQAKDMCRGCRARLACLTGAWSVGSPGASGAASCSCAARSCRGSVRVGGRARANSQRRPK